MTPRQRNLLRFIERFLADHDGTSPSFAEMTAGLGLASKSAIHRLLPELEAQGHIIRRRRHARAIELTRPASELAAYATPTLVGELIRRGEWPGHRPS